jgi:hypothetical protein
MHSQLNNADLLCMHCSLLPYRECIHDLTYQTCLERMSNVSKLVYAGITLNVK